MLQFNTYKLDGEPWGFRHYVKKIRKLYLDYDYSSLKNLVNRSHAKYKSVCRYHLINSRLYLWGLIDSDIGLEAKNFAIEGFNNLDNFSRQEFLGCLQGLEIKGNELYRQFNQMIEGRGDCEINDSSLKLVRPIKLFTPRRSGFFSVIENIIVASFVAEQDGVALMLSPERDWWPYEVSFHQIFGNSLGLRHDKNIYQDLSVGFDEARGKVAHLNIDNGYIFYAYKRKVYSVTHSLVLRYLSGLEITEQGIPVYFVRAGDKLELETVLPPERLVQKNLSSVLNKFGSIGILSDDYNYAESLRLRLSHLGACNLTSKNCNGHELSASTSTNDVITILKNFILLRQSPVKLSCPSSNLVNAAHWSRPHDDQNMLSDLNPVEKYLLF
jgi:hypothetical protein